RVRLNREGRRMSEQRERELFNKARVDANSLSVAPFASLSPAIPRPPHILFRKKERSRPAEPGFPLIEQVISLVPPACRFTLPEALVGPVQGQWSCNECDEVHVQGFAAIALHIIWDHPEEGLEPIDCVNF